MKSSLLYDLINVRYLTTGRRIFALTETRKLAEAESLPEVVGAVDEGLTHDKEALRLERSWRRSRGASQARGEAVLIDNRIDSVVAAIHTQLKGQADVLGPDDATGKAARELLDGLFPGGIRAVIHRPFEEELAELKRIESLLDGELKTAAEETSIGRFVQELGKLTADFAAELKKQPEQEVTWDQVRAAQDLGNLHFRHVVAKLLTATGGLGNDAEAKRAELLGPILDQDRRQAEAFRRRRGLVDVDPDTGEEDPDTLDDAQPPLGE